MKNTDFPVTECTVDFAEIFQECNFFASVLLETEDVKDNCAFCAYSCAGVYAEKGILTIPGFSTASSILESHFSLFVSQENCCKIFSRQKALFLSLSRSK